MSKQLFPLFSLLALATGLALAACQKEGADPVPGNTARIDITSPAEGATFGVGNTVPIDVTITGQESLHGWEILLRNKANNSQLGHFSEHVHGSTLNISENWPANVASGTEVVLEVVVELDHDGNEATESLNFKIQ